MTVTGHSLACLPTSRRPDLPAPEQPRHRLWAQPSPPAQSHPEGGFHSAIQPGPSGSRSVGKPLRPMGGDRRRPRSAAGPGEKADLVGGKSRPPQTPNLSAQVSPLCKGLKAPPEQSGLGDVSALVQTLKAGVEKEGGFRLSPWQLRLNR